MKEFAEQVWGGDVGCFATAFGPVGRKPTREWWPESLEQFASKVEAIHKTDQYHFHMGVFRFSKRKRLNANAVQSSVFVVDVDADAADPQVRDSINALSTMIGAPSWEVFSGRGLHLYWTMTAPVPLDGWMVTAKWLRSLVEAFPAINKDTAPITAPARLIRVPGSINDRRGQRSFITENSTMRPVDHAVFRERIAAYADIGTTPFSADLGPPPKMKNPELVFHECWPIQRMHETGSQSYEAWFAAARLFSWSEDESTGRQLFHEFSKTHPGYDPAETDAKFTNALETADSPPSCEALRKASGVSCEECPLAAHKNSMPVRLEEKIGSAAPPAKPQADVEPVGQAGAVDTVTTSRDTKPTQKHGQRSVATYIPHGNETLQRAVDYIISRREAFEDWVPVAIGSDIASTINRMANNKGAIRICPASGRMLHIEDPDDPESKVTILSSCGFVINEKISSRESGLSLVVTVFKPKNPVSQSYRTAGEFSSVVASNPLVITDWVYKMIPFRSDTIKDRYTPSRIISSLSKDVLTISSSSPAAAGIMRTYVDDMVMSGTQPIHSSDRHGWQEDGSFCIGDVTIKPDGSLTYNVSAEIFDKDRTVRVDGDIEAARSAAARLYNCLTEEARPLFWLVLGAPMMEFLPQKAALAYLSGGTGVGKTAAAMATSMLYASVPKDRSPLNGHDTLLSIYHSIGQLHNLPTIIDELTSMNNNGAQDLVINLVQGRERHRMFRDGATKREGSTWATTVIVTSNKPVVDITVPLTEAGMAETARVIDFSSNNIWTDHTSDPARIIPDLSANRGLVGMDFIHNMLSQIGYVKQQLLELATDPSVFPGDGAGDIGRFWRSARAVAMMAAHVYAPVLGLDSFEEMDLLSKYMQERYEAAKRSVRRFVAGAFNSLIARSMPVLAFGSKKGIDDENYAINLPENKIGQALGGVVLTTAGSIESEIIVTRDALESAARYAFPESVVNGRPDVDYIVRNCGFEFDGPGSFQAFGTMGSNTVHRLAFSDAYRIKARLQSPATENRVRGVLALQDVAERFAEAS